MAWEESVPHLERPGWLEHFRWEEEGAPAFELGLCPNKWASARSLGAVLRGISRFPGLRPDLVEHGLTHPVISVRLAALGAAAVWPDDTFTICARWAQETDPVRAVRERAGLVADRRVLDAERYVPLLSALHEIEGIPETRISHFLSTPVVQQYEIEEHALTYIEFADHLNQVPGHTMDGHTSKGRWAICLDPLSRHLLWAERA